MCRDVVVGTGFNFQDSLKSLNDIDLSVNQIRENELFLQKKRNGISLRKEKKKALGT